MDDAGATIEVRVVPDAACPECGAAWGHANPELDFCNRPKVQDVGGYWWWRCYNPYCDVYFYEPGTGVTS